MKPGVEIEFFKGDGTRYRSVLVREDGVTLELDGGSWNKIAGSPGRIPHDIAHVIVESELGLTRGLWGVLAAGGIVQNAKVIDGRQPPNAAKRAEAVVAPARESLRQAEVIVRAVVDLSLAGTPDDVAAFNRATGERWRVSVSADQLSRIQTQLAAAAKLWEKLAAGSSQRMMSPAYLSRTSSGAMTFSSS